VGIPARFTQWLTVPWRRNGPGLIIPPGTELWPVTIRDKTMSARNNGRLNVRKQSKISANKIDTKPEELIPTKI